ncbi:TPA: hypothetical protein N0F65_002703 [Lagenidium giganteum]|uniref:Kazal-like domain-containing protein n=1 Tax=Lagenidium giganteum TaxID=4803 RepID=A0AAV2Z486_9STRA|nr:TPA: hypothetical protein N0F65_002703 [Lagenidium giganteum]
MFRSFLVALLFSSAPSSARAACAEGEAVVSVEGVGDFCAKTPLCSGFDPEGNCPGPTTGLEFGAYCGVVASSDQGCLPYDSAQPSSSTSSTSTVNGNNNQQL